MARIEVHSDRITVILSRSEKLLAFHRKNIVIDRSQVRSALITDDPWIWMRGIPSPGTHLAGRIACGVWRGLGGEDFLLVRGKHQAVVIDVDVAHDDEELTHVKAEDDAAFSHFGRVIISTAHAADLIRALKLDGEAGSKVHTTQVAKKRKAKNT